jgi:nucleotide-binding universal stress UspA family protein
MIRNILTPTDFSAPADAALEAAIELAKRVSARIHLLHAYDVGTEVALPLPPGLIDAVRAQVQGQLEQLEKRLERAGVAHESHLSAAPAVPSILERVPALSIDLIAMGTRGLSGLKHVLLGSVAERTVRLAPCPVLAVHAQEQRRPLGPKLLVAVDFSPLAPAVVRHALEFARAFGTPQLTLVHAYQLPPHIEVYARTHAGPLLDGLSERVREELEGRVSELRSAGVSCDSIARIGSPAEVIAHAASELGCDAIAMGTHGRTGIAHAALGSVAERVLRTAPCPVLTVKTAA